MRSANDIHYVPEMGERLQRIIFEKDINLAEMSRKTRISRTTIWELIYNGRNTGVYQLAAVCKYLGVSADYILGLKEAKV